MCCLHLYFYIACICLFSVHSSIAFIIKGTYMALRQKIQMHEREYLLSKTFSTQQVSLKFSLPSLQFSSLLINRTVIDNATVTTQAIRRISKQASHPCCHTNLSTLSKISKRNLSVQRNISRTHVLLLQSIMNCDITSSGQHRHWPSSNQHQYNRFFKSTSAAHLFK